jgi:hypothetical protein
VFNFYDLQLQDGGQLNYYTVQDSRVSAADQSLYNYYFNICGGILAYPTGTVCDKINQTYCPQQYIKGNNCTTSESNKGKIQPLSQAYQVPTDDPNSCYALSNGAEVSYSLIDAGDPTQGFSITYPNGAWNNDCGRNRELIITLKCENDVSAIPSHTDVAEDQCHYELTFNTIHGCPVGCQIYANSLCATQGLCGYDYSSNASRCFCFSGFSGSACEKYDEDTFEEKEYSQHQNVATDPRVHQFTDISTEITDPITGELTKVQFDITYDLSLLYATDRVYEVTDAYSSSYQYFFNVAGYLDLDKLPSACKSVRAPCTTNTTYCDSHSTTSELRGYAFRYYNATKDGKNSSFDE